MIWFFFNNLLFLKNWIFLFFCIFCWLFFRFFLFRFLFCSFYSYFRALGVMKGWLRSFWIDKWVFLLSICLTVFIFISLIIFFMFINRISNMSFWSITSSAWTFRPLRLLTNFPNFILLSLLFIFLFILFLNFQISRTF